MTTPSTTPTTDSCSLNQAVARAVQNFGLPTATGGGRIQRSAVPPIGADGGDIDADTSRAIRSTRGSGSGLPPTDRATMEAAFGADFSGVRVHQGPQASELNDRIQAKAFTVGQDIYFRDGHPDTGSTEGQHLLAHELAHTIQQTGRAQRMLHTNGAVVQRVNEARTALDKLTALYDRAVQIADEAALGTATGDRFGVLSREIDQIALDAASAAASAEKDKNYNGFKGPIKQKVDQIGGRQRAFAASRLQTMGQRAVDEADAIAGEFHNTIATTIGGAQDIAGEALRQLKIAAWSKTPDAADAAATVAARLSGELKTFHTEQLRLATAKITEITQLETTFAEWHFVNRIGDAKTKLEKSKDLLTQMLTLLRDDARRASVGARAVADSLTASAQAAQDVGVKQAAAQRAARATQQAEQLVIDTARSSAEAAKLADEAEGLAAEAAESARIAEGVAAASAVLAQTAVATSVGLNTSLDFRDEQYKKYPTGDVVPPREAAAQARQQAESATAKSDEDSESAREVRQTSDRKNAEAGDQRSAATKAAETQAQAGLERDRRIKEQAEAEDDERDAGDLAEQRSNEAKGVVGAQQKYAKGMTTLEKYVPDPTQRAQLRVDFGSGNMSVFAKRKVPVAVLTEATATVQQMVASWAAAATADVLVAAQTKGLSTAVLLTSAFGDVAADPVLTSTLGPEFVNCIGTTATWFAKDGATGARRLLVKGWPATDVKRVVVAAEDDAKLKSAHFSKFAKMVDEVNVPVGDAELLLKSKVTADFLIGNAMSSIRTLLGLAAPWPVAKIIELVKAAEKYSKPTKAEFAKFCTLIASETVSIDDSVKIMDSADCPGSYLVDKAFIALKDLVAQPWTPANIRKMVKPAAASARLSKAQIERFGKLLRDNADLTANRAKQCLESAGVADWTFLMNQVDNFIADGNKGNPAAVAGNLTGTRPMGPPENLNLWFNHERTTHFCVGHTFTHYEFTTANIYRGNGQQPSTMWARGTTAVNVQGSAQGALNSAGVLGQARDALAGIGTKGNFDQCDYATCTVGMDGRKMTQFFPYPGISIDTGTMAAIARLFGKTV